MRFVLYSRPGCGLCEEMRAELDRLPAARGYPLEVLDVDADSDTRARYGHKIPVLLFAGQKELRAQTETIMRQAAGRPGHIFNLGHGILPETPVENVQALVNFVRELSAKISAGAR